MEISRHELQVSEKYVVNFHLEVRNKGGHSSLPVADDAIYHLAGALDRLSRFGFPVKTNVTYRPTSRKWPKSRQDRFAPTSQR